MATPNTVKKPAANSASLVNLRNQIRQAVATLGHPSTAELATEVNEERDRVYRQCRRLENEGVLTRSRGFRRRLFCVDCRRVVTGATYDACRHHDIRAFNAAVSEWERIPQGPQAPQPKAVN